MKCAICCLRLPFPLNYMNFGGLCPLGILKVSIFLEYGFEYTMESCELPSYCTLIVLLIISYSCWIERDPMSVATWSTFSFSSALSIKGSSFSSISSFGGLTFGLAFSSCCASKRLTSVAISNSFSSMVLVSLAIALLIYASYSLMDVEPVVVTCMSTGYELLLESASEVNDLSLQDTSCMSTGYELLVVITGSFLECSCSLSKVNVGVEDTAETAFTLIWVVTPKVPPLVAKMFLFFALIMRTA
ncbi:hypothetical protein ACFX19_035178 [Malus domestica]